MYGGFMGLFTAQRVSVTQWILAHGRGQIGPIVGVDFETDYSSTYSVSRLGIWAYVHDARFEAWAVAVSDGQLTCVCQPHEFPWETIGCGEWVSHNRAFDEAVFLRLVELGIIGRGVVLRPLAWHCSAAACAFLQLPRDLAGAAKAVFGVTLNKDFRTRAKGRDRSADLFGLSVDAKDYAGMDAEMALALWKKVGPYWPVHERILDDLTCAMGVRGVCVSWPRVAEFQKQLDGLTESLRAYIPWSPPLSLPKFEAACVAAGVPVPVTTAADDPEFQEWAQENQRHEVVTYARHMQRWRSINRVSKVLDSMVGRVKPDDRMAFELKYFGASTGRWSGGGGLNVQNLNRKAVEGVDLRSCIVAPPGYRLVVVDYAQIEARVLLFLAGDVESLDLFRANPDADAYEIHARATMGWRPESFHREGREGREGGREETLRGYCARTGSGIRQLAKARVLGLGFGCGAQRFVEVAKVMAGLDVEAHEAERIVAEFRASNPKIVQLWQRLNDACAACDGSEYVLPLPCTQLVPAANRYLFYRDVQVGKDGIECTIGGDRVKVYGGLLAENWTQATARDVLASAWLRCDLAGFRPVLSVHDELVFEVPVATAAADLARIVAIFERSIPWAPGLPLRAEGKLCDVYGK